MWGARVVVPAQGRTKLLQVLHIGHPGICRMKGLAWTVIWWPNIDSEIEEMVKRCKSVSTYKSSSTSGTTKPFIMAIQTIVSYSHGLRWTSFKPSVSCNN